MRLNLRNLYIGIVCVVLAAVGYLLISLLSSREPIVIEKSSQFSRPDSNMLRSGQIGRIGDVNIAEMENPVYKHLNAKGEVDREFTFKRILQAVGDKWEVENPGISFFRDDLSVIVTADKADVQTETVLKQVRPKDAALAGNVVVHIQPKESADIKESFAYLDNISFESDSSRAFTSGPVRFVSENIQLTGTGMEFVYNAEKRRLEFFKIDDLNSLQLKIPAKSTPLSTGRKDIAAKNAVSHSQSTSMKDTDKASEYGGKIYASEEKGANSAGNKTLYQLMFNKNVVIDSPRQVIFTDRFNINNVFLKQSAPNAEDSEFGKLGRAENPETQKEAAAENKTDTNRPVENSKNTGGSEELMPVTVKCEGGILVTPMDSDRRPEPIDSKDSVTGGRGLAKYGDPKDKTTLEGRKLEFDAASNLAVLQGNCRAKMLAPSSSIDRRYSIAAQRIAANLAEKNEGQMFGELSHIRADGGVVQFAVEKLEQNRTLGFTKIKCFNFDFDSASQTLAAGGPGLIAIDNSKLTKKEIDALKPQENIARNFSLQKPCYAIIMDFASLEYNLKTEHILAQAGKNRMNIGYMPIIDGKEGQVVRATVGKVEAKLIQTATGQRELVKLYASDGVTYDEKNNATKGSKNKNLQLVGSDLIYNVENAANPVITVWGNQSWPCFLNGVQVDGIEYQLSTGRIKEAKILAPGALW